MYAPDFDYYRAGSVTEVGRLLRKHPGAKLLAGGHSLIPLLKLRLATPSALIDIGRIGALKGIDVAEDRVRIGALTTHTELASSSALAEHAPALAEAASLIGDPAVRNHGTIGGNVAHADPASDLPTVLRALEASISVATDTGQRSIPAGDFFQGMMATPLGEHDLVTAIEIPFAARGQGQAYEKFSHPASRYAVVGVAATVVIENGKVERVAVALGGPGPAATRAASVERALTGQAPSAEAVTAAAAEVTADLGDDLIGDLYASAEYRRAMAPIRVRRALTAALARASSESAREGTGVGRSGAAGASAPTADTDVETAVDVPAAPPDRTSAGTPETSVDSPDAGADTAETNADAEATSADTAKGGAHDADADAGRAATGTVSAGTGTTDAAGADGAEASAGGTKTGAGDKVPWWKRWV